MVKLSVCVETFWKGQSLPEKVRRVKELGFPAFEFWGWRNKNLEELVQVQQETGLTVSAMCTEPNFVLTAEGNEKVLLEGVVASAAVARKLQCSRLIVTTGSVVAGETREQTRRRVVRKLRLMVQAATEHGMELLLEPLNPVVNHPGYWLTKVAQAVDLLEEVNAPGLKILFDIYHQQVTEGNLLAKIERYLPLIGHFHAAGVPGRCELVGGELNYRAIFSAIDRLGYSGYVGLEFTPVGKDEDALRQALSLTG
ncbi:MAG TPA: TIM barrel protein [bacterium]|nr:TIM barrel protein [bacterium]